MSLLLDTHVVIAICREELGKTYPGLAKIETGAPGLLAVSVASIWEIAIKTRVGKLDPGRPLDEVAEFLQGLGLELLPVRHEHVTALVDPQPETRDPFDRLLLAQCHVEGFRLVTMDRALIAHPLAWKPGEA